MRNIILPPAAGLALLAGAAHAEPGLGSEVYGARVDKGEAEAEVLYGRLDGGSEDGEDALVLEGAYGVTDRLRLGLRAETEREPGSGREFEALGFEAIHELGSVGGIDFAVYGEYEVVFEGADKLEAKLLMQKTAGPLDLRFNLIGEKHLAANSPVELEYAASADVAAVGELRLGAKAFGQLGTFDQFLPHAAHYVGPAARIEIEGLGPEFEIEAGYLFALGSARQDTNGQMRLALEMEF